MGEFPMKFGRQPNRIACSNSGSRICQAEEHETSYGSFEYPKKDITSTIQTFNNEPVQPLLQPSFSYGSRLIKSFRSFLFLSVSFLLIIAINASLLGTRDSNWQPEHSFLDNLRTIATSKAEERNDKIVVIQIVKLKSPHHHHHHHQSTKQSKDDRTNGNGDSDCDDSVENVSDAKDWKEYQDKARKYQQNGKEKSQKKKSFRKSSHQESIDQSGIPRTKVANENASSTNETATLSSSFKGRVLEDTSYIDVNVPCEDAFQKPVFRNYLDEQQMVHTLVDRMNSTTIIVKEIAPHLYEEQSVGKNQSASTIPNPVITVYVTYNDDSQTADMILVDGFDIFSNYHEHYEFISLPSNHTKTSSIDDAAVVGRPINAHGMHSSPSSISNSSCRIIRHLSGVLTKDAAAANNDDDSILLGSEYETKSQWLKDHDQDMKLFQRIMNSS